MDRIRLHEVEFRGYHGVSAEERAVGGHYSADVEIETDTRRAGRTDRVEETVDYGQLFEIVHRVGSEEQFQLLEALAERMAGSILELPGVSRVRIAVRKHRPPLPGVVGCAVVEIVRESERRNDG